MTTAPVATDEDSQSGFGAATTLRVPNFRFLWAANALRSAAGDLGAFALSITAALLRLFLTQASLNNLGAGMLMATASYYMLRVIGIDPWLFGALSSIGAVTGVVATLLCVGCGSGSARFA